MSTPVEMANYAGMFNLDALAPPVDKRNVKEVRLFAPGWDADKTNAFAPRMSLVRSLVLLASAYGMEDDEISMEITSAWPDLTLIDVRTEARGTRVVLEAL